MSTSSIDGAGAAFNGGGRQQRPPSSVGGKGVVALLRRGGCERTTSHGTSSCRSPFLCLGLSSLILVFSSLLLLEITSDNTSGTTTTSGEISVSRTLMVRGAQREDERVFAVALPFHENDTQAMVATLTKSSAWSAVRVQKEVGIAIDLILYTSGCPDNKHEEQEGQVQQSQIPDTVLSITQQGGIVMFREIRMAYGCLSPDEDRSHAQHALSNMFYKIFLDPEVSKEYFASYERLLLLDWRATAAVSPQALEKIRNLAFLPVHSHIWMMGGMAQGPSVDRAVRTGQSTNLALSGHIDGNAVYKLHDDDFHSFLRYVRVRHPPEFRSNVFDLAIWKSVYDLPYTWLIYQALAPMFKYTQLVRS
jgi:hypothetical protein